MGHHSKGNIHALRLTTGSMCFYIWLGTLVMLLQTALAQSHFFESLKEDSSLDEFSESLRPMLHFGQSSQLIRTVSSGVADKRIIACLLAIQILLMSSGIAVENSQYSNIFSFPHRVKWQVQSNQKNLDKATFHNTSSLCLHVFAQRLNMMIISCTCTFNFSFTSFHIICFHCE